MPQRNRIRFLIGFAACVGACAGGAGCQTSSVQTDGYSVRTMAAVGWNTTPTTAPISVPGPVIATSSPGPRPAAMIGPALCVWQPAQRVDAAKPAAPADAIARVSDPPSMGGAVQAAIEIPQPIAIAGAAPPGEPAAPLPPPRLEPQPIVVEPDQPAFHSSAPHELAKQSLPPYVVEPPDILIVEATAELTKGFQPISGSHLVRPDGSMSLGVYGNVHVAGLTLDAVKEAVVAQLHSPGYLDKIPIDDIKKSVVVDVLAYNSKVYYVITDGGGYGAQVYSIPITGNETVLDALGKIGGLPPVASMKRIWVARATADCDHPVLLPVDWCGVAKNGCTATNYQIFPNDRVYVASDKLIVASSKFRKWLDIPQQVLGITLLGSSTVNSIRNHTNGTTP